MRRDVLIASVRRGKEDDLIHAMQSHEPTTALERAGMKACSFCIGSQRLAIILEAEDGEFQDAYGRLFRDPQWTAMMHKIAPFVDGLPKPAEFEPTARMPFAGEVVRWEEGVRGARRGGRKGAAVTEREDQAIA